MKPAEIAASYFASGRVMQIATLHEGQPRANTVFFVASSDNKFVYWMSEPRRRHSEDIEKDSRVGGAIAIKLDQPVAGLQFIGTARVLTDLDEIKDVATKYNQKYDGVANDFYERYVDGQSLHRIYKLTINDLELFDEVNFPGGNTIIVSLG